MRFHSHSLLFLTTLGSLCSRMLRGFQLQSRGGVWSSLQSQFRRFSNPSVIGESSFVDNELKKINLIATETFHGTGEMLIVPYFSSGSTTAALKATLEKLPAQVAKSIADIVDEKSVKPGDKMATKIIHLYPNLHSFKSVALVGLGAQHDASELNSNLAHVLGKAIVKCVKESSPESVTLLSPIAMSKSSISHVLLGFHDAWYKDDRFKAQVGDPMSAPTSLSLQILGCDKNVCDNISEIQSSSEKIASGVNLAKDLVGAPSNVKTPLLISQVAKTIAANYNLEAKILGEV